MEGSDELNEVDELAGNPQAPLEKWDRESEDFADDRATLLEQVAANAEAFVKERKTHARQPVAKRADRRV